MLINAHTLKEETNVAVGERRRFFEEHKSRLTDDELDAIYDYINEKIDEKINGYFVPGFDAAGSWQGTPLQAIYDNACDKNKENSGFLYGLLAKETIINRNDIWYFTRQVSNGRDIETNQYFKPKK